MRYCFALGSFNSGIHENILMYILYLQIFVRNHSAVIVNYWIHVVIIWILSFVCFLGGLFDWSFSSHSRIFSLIWRRHHYRWRSANCDLCSALMSNEQKGFFGVSHLLWHGSSVYNGHLRGPMTLAPIAERLAVDLHYLFCPGWDSNTKPSAYRANALAHCATAVVWYFRHF